MEWFFIGGIVFVVWALIAGYNHPISHKGDTYALVAVVFAMILIILAITVYRA